MESEVDFGAKPEKYREGVILGNGGCMDAVVSGFYALRNKKGGQ